MESREETIRRTEGMNVESKVVKKKLSIVEEIKEHHKICSYCIGYHRTAKEHTKHLMNVIKCLEAE